MCIFVLCLIIKSISYASYSKQNPCSSCKRFNYACSLWLSYWSETLGVEFPQSGYVKCDCCKEYHLITDFVGAHVVNTMDGETYIYPTCKHCNDTYKNSKAPEGIFFAFIDLLCPVP